MKTPQKTLEPLGIKKLSNKELEFMEVIWAHPEGIQSEEIYAMFGQALGTKSTILHRIAEKGLVTVARRGKHFTYFPKITKEAYTQAFFREKLEKEFGISSFEGMVAAFCGRTALTPDEEERVRQLLKELRDDV